MFNSCRPVWLVCAKGCSLIPVFAATNSSHTYTPPLLIPSISVEEGKKASFLLDWGQNWSFVPFDNHQLPGPGGPSISYFKLKKKKILQYPPLPKYLIWISVFITKFSILRKKNFLRKRNLVGDLVLWCEYLLLWSLKQHRFLICD